MEEKESDRARRERDHQQWFAATTTKGEERRSYRRRRGAPKKTMMSGKEGEEVSKMAATAASTILVGFKMDVASRELLTWALVVAAAPGDRVVAVHVLPASPSSSSSPAIVASDSAEGKPPPPPSTLMAMVRGFDSVLDAYEGFCNLKQIDLKLRVCSGSSLRKVLVREATSYDASKLVLGVGDTVRAAGLSSPTSIAKYCAKKLPLSCSVLAVSNGKVVFERESLQEDCKGGVPDLRSNSVPCSSFVPADVSGTLSCLLLANNHPCSGRPAKPKTQTDLAPSSLYCLLPPKPHWSRGADDCGYNGLSCEKEPSGDGEVVEDRLALVQPLNHGSHSPTCITCSIVRPPESIPGWSFLRRVILSSWQRSKSTLRLPGHYSPVPSAIHPDQKPAKNEDATSVVVAAAAVNEEEKLPEALKSIRQRFSSVSRVFSYEELKHATSNFSPENFIGEGGSSRVFKGRLPDSGKELAVKVLKKPSGTTALDEFAAEIEIVTKLQHKNIISLVGFCLETNHLILVYDFLPNGSLEECLHGKREDRKVLSWGERFKVALGVAEALTHLHCCDGGEAVVHRDVKSSNILLSQDFEPRLSDFGLAIPVTSATVATMTSSDLAGTFGYLAPEYLMYGRLTEKIDVYAFGVMLLELLSGRKPITTGNSNGQESLVIWAQKILQGGNKVEQFVDPCLGGDGYNMDQMERMILAASLCIRSLESRPKIVSVLKLLQGDVELLRLARLQVTTSGASEELAGIDNNGDGDGDPVAMPNSDIRSHISLALLGVEDDSLSSISRLDPSAAGVAAFSSFLEATCKEDAPTSQSLSLCE